MQSRYGTSVVDDINEDLVRAGWAVALRGEDCKGRPVFEYRKGDAGPWLDSTAAWAEEMKPTETDIAANPPNAWLLYRGWACRASRNPHGLYLYSRPGDSWLPESEALNADCTYGPKAANWLIGR